MNKKRILAVWVVLTLVCQGLFMGSSNHVLAANDNLVLGQTATGTGLDENGSNCLNSKKPASNAIDGDASTKFASWSSGRTGSLTIQLDAMTSFNRVVIQEPTERIKKYSIEVSGDGQNWETMLQNQDKTGVTTVEHCIEPVSAKYLRVSIQEVALVNGYGGFEIAEVELYTDNLVLGKTLTGTGLDENGDNALNWRKPASLAGDNDRDTRFESWSSGRSGSITVDLGTARNVNQVAIDEPTTRISSYSIQVSTDGESYTTILSGLNKSHRERVAHGFETVNVRYVRVSMDEITLVNGYGGFSIAEYEVYYDGRKEGLLQVMNEARRLHDESIEGTGNGEYAPADRQGLMDAIENANLIYNDGLATTQAINEAASQLSADIESFRWTIHYHQEEFNKIKDARRSKMLEGTAPSESSVQGAMTLIDDPSNVTEGTITHAYSRLITLAKAYLFEGSSYYGDQAILDQVTTGMDYMYTHYYNENTVPFGNWWNWQIGTARRLVDLTVMVEEYLTDEQITNYMNAVMHFIDPSYVEWDGANRVDVAFIEILRGALTDTGYQVQRGTDAMKDDFNNVESGDGFYEDGSFLYHNGSPYSGNYGLVQVHTLLGAISILGGTPWAYGDQQMNNLYNWVYDGFEPLVYHGELMNMVNGRFLGVGHSKGHSVMSLAVELARYSPEPHATRLKAMVKEWLLKDTCSSASSLRQAPKYSEILADSSIDARGPLYTTKRYPNMDRVVHRRLGFLFGISMFSDRVKTFEAVNGNGKIAWYASSGMTYLYNDESDYYDNGYWPTIDWYRLPGITVDTMPRTTTRWEGEMKSDYDWVGGTDIGGLYGTSGMELEQYNTDLYAKKSWFMFDDEIVALGSDITCTGGRTIETIMDNRKLTASGDNALTVDGVALSSSLGWADSLQEVDWMHLAGNTGEGSSVGYYFPTATTIKGLREARTGTMEDVNTGDSTDEITKNYMTLWLDHGINPTKDTYAYVVLPNKSKEEVASYGSDITILANNEDVHAVKENSLGIIGANFWTDASVTIEGITCNKKAAVMAYDKGNELEISVSDPTMKNTGTIEVEINTEGAEVIVSDPEITVTQLSPTIRLTVNTANTAGRTLSLRVSK